MEKKASFRKQRREIIGRDVIHLHAPKPRRLEKLQSSEVVEDGNRVERARLRIHTDE